MNQLSTVDTGPHVNSSLPTTTGVEITPGQEAPVVNQGHDTHLVQLYSDDGLLLDVLCRFIGGAIAVGDGGVVIATKAHLDGLGARLRARGFDTATAISHGRYVPVDAEETLPRIMANGQVDETRFNEIIGDLLTRARTAADCPDSRIAVFGELVALLWAKGKAQEALRLEQLWNNLAKKHYFSLLCAYPITGFDDDRHIEPFLKMCAQHSGVVPSESYVGLSSMEERLRTIADLQQRTQALEHALKLRQSEERFRLLVEAVQDYAIFILDPDGHVVSWNNGAQRIKGYQAAEIIGKHFSCFYPPADLQNGKPRWELEVASKEGRFEVLGQCNHHRHSRRCRQTDRVWESHAGFHGANAGTRRSTTGNHRTKGGPAATVRFGEVTPATFQALAAYPGRGAQADWSRTAR